MSKFLKYFSLLNIILLMLSLFTSSIFLTGCMDKNEVQSLAFAVALGIDLDNNNDVIASVQVLRAGNNTNSEGAYQSAKADVFLSSGKTIYDAISGFSTKIKTPIKFSNEKCIVIGRKFAEKGIAPIIDLSLRYSDMRPSTPILVTPGKAIDILNSPITENPIPALEIEALIKNQRHQRLASITTNLDFINSMTGETAVSTCGVISIDKKDEKINTSTLILSGSAVFKKDNLIGFLNDKETRGMYWIKGKVKSGILIIESPKENKMSFNILRSGSRMKASINDKKADISISIKAESNIREIDENTYEAMNFNTNPEKITLLSEEQNKAIYDEVNLAIIAAQKRLFADIFDFGDLLYRETPHEWNTIKADWDEFFPSANIEVNVSSQIVQTGGLSKTID